MKTNKMKIIILKSAKNLRALDYAWQKMKNSGEKEYQKWTQRNVQRFLRGK